MHSLLWRKMVVCLVLVNAEISSAEKGTIKSGDMSKWFRQAYTINGSGVLWKDPKRNAEASYTEVRGKDPDFLFDTNPVQIEEEYADVINVNIEAKVQLCKNQTNYTNSFKVYVYRGETVPNIPKKPPHIIEKILVDNFTHIYNITSKAKSNGMSIKSNYLFTFYKNGSKAVTLAVRSGGACGKIYRMEMYYYYCKKVYIHSILFAKTQSPASDPREVEANCSANSSPFIDGTVLKGYCQSDGTWDIDNRTKCLCNQGYELNTSRGCLPCNTNYFKANISNDKCTQCPLNSVNTTDKTSCKCRNNFYRNDVNEALLPCHGLINIKLKLTIKRIERDAINLTWNKPKQRDRVNERLQYDVECYSCVKNTCNTTCVDEEYRPGQFNLSHTSVVVSNLHMGTSYSFRVYPKNNINLWAPRVKWNFTQTEPYLVRLDANKEARNSAGSYYSYIAVAGVGCVLLFATILFLVFVVLRRRGNYKRELIIPNPNQVELPSIGQRMYIDPTNYDTPEDALSEFASELEPSILFLEKLIGGGEFGDVYKGHMKYSHGKNIPIAVKTLKRDASAKSERDFLLEASVMGQFDDPNVIRLEGVVTKSIPRMIVTEFMSNGSLDHFLVLNDDNLTQPQLIGMARGIASGMKYLAGINFIHRDLAARNVLVNDELVCKISDFGLSRAVETEGSSCGEYSTTGGKIPVRWTAPEAIKYRKFSSASDVWSFGIVVWEIMSFGLRPYWEWDNFRVMREVEEGFRLPVPTNCPKAVHDLMLQCWNSTRSERPKFEDITQILDRWIKSPEILRQSSLNLDDWLRSIKMGNYLEHFIAAGYDSPCQLSDLSDANLREMGITLIGHRNKILKSIKALQGQENGHVLRKRITSIVV